MLEIEKLLNRTVIHKVFGRGVVCAADDKHLEVEFPEKNKKSKFAYPSCFDGFLSLEGSELETEVQAAVGQWREESGADEREALIHRYEKTMRAIQSRQAAAEEKKLKAAQKAMEHRSNYSNIRQAKKD